MSHFDARMHEICSDDPAAATVRKERLAEMRREHDRVAEHFFPTIWAARTLNDAKKRARLRGLAYDLNVGHLVRLLDRQHYACAVSSVPFSGRKPRDSHKRPWMPSLDRIDCTKGYTKDNVRIVCVAVNTMLQDWGDTVFHEIIKASR